MGNKTSISGPTATMNHPLTARGLRTRTNLVKAARALFEKNGFLDTNVAAITARAHVAHGTFYTYFASKEEIFSEVVELLLADTRRIADEEPSVAQDGWLSERIERANRGYLNAYLENARMMAVLEQVATFNPRMAQVRRMSRQYSVQRSAEAIRRWQGRGLIDPRIDPVYAANSLGSMVDRSAYVWIVLGEPYQLDVAVDQLTRLYCNALALPYHRDDPTWESTADRGPKSSEQTVTSIPGRGSHEGRNTRRV